jgi:hypothetical protein
MALQAASLRAHVETVALLLDKGTDPNVQGVRFKIPSNCG